MRLFQTKPADATAQVEGPAAAPIVLTLEHAASVAGGINPQPLPPCHHED